MRFMIIVLLINFVSYTYGWGREVHYIIADIAGSFLPDRHARYIQDLFGYTKKGNEYISEQLASISANADDVYKYPYKKYRRYHYGHATMDFKVPEKYPNQCIVTGIALFSAMAGDIVKTNEERAFAIEMLVHLMGDIHQPLHMGLRSDLGGNRIPNVWQSYDQYIPMKKKLIPKYYNLHQLWDKGLFRFYEEEVLKPMNKENQDPNSKTPVVKIAGWRILSESLGKRITEYFKAEAEYPYMNRLNVAKEEDRLKFAEWIATESIRNAEQIVYENEHGDLIKRIKRIPKVSFAYMRTRLEYMKIMLMKAGYRLARLLELIVEYSMEKDSDDEWEIVISDEDDDDIPDNVGLMKSEMRSGPQSSHNLRMPLGGELKNIPTD